MQQMWQRVAWFCVVLALWGEPAAFGQSPKTGEFQATFTERSPLSKKDDLLKRLGEPASDDYDLSQHPFTVYVPKNYDPAAPLGIVFYMAYKDTTSTPPKWHEMLDKSRLIFISSLRFNQPDWHRAGLALDAIHNLSQQYKIDSSRIYLLSFPQPPGTIPQRLTLSSPDVFTGTVIIEWMKLFRPVRDPGGRGTFPAAFTPPPAAVLNRAAATQRVVLVVRPQSANSASHKMAVQLYKDAGFKDLLRIDLTDPEDVHYPNFTTPWFEKALAVLDQPRTSPLPAPVAPPSAASAPPATPSAASPLPATRPAVSEPQRLLNLSKSYITARSYPAARTRLQEIVAKYPNDPAAREAKTLLDQIKDQ